MRKLIPIIMLLFGLGGGVASGMMLRPEPEAPAAEDAAEGDTADKAETKKTTKAKPTEDEAVEKEYVKLNNQFVIPLVEDSQVSAVVVMSLSVEVKAGNRDAVFLKEPKLRDSFLYAMFDHASIGGFSGAFTDATKLDILRTALREVAQRDLGDYVTDVLILEIARQDY